jgi:hypothetical protein
MALVLAVAMCGSRVNRSLLIFRAHIVLFTLEGIRNPSYTSRYSSDPCQELADLTVDAQRELTSPEWYGFGIEYREPYRVDADRADLMAKTLRKVNRSLHQQDEKYGRVSELAHYLARCGVAIGARYGSPTAG